MVLTGLLSGGVGSALGSSVGSSLGAGGGFFSGVSNWLLPGIGAAGGILDGLFGGDDRRLQMELLGKATGTLDYGLGQIPGMRERALTDVDAANMILDSVEPAVLNGIDEAGRIRIAQQVMRSQQERAMQDQRLASAGLDATTVAPGVQRGQAYSDAQALANIGAEFAGIRSNAIMNARNAAAQGRLARAGIQGQYDDRSLGLIRDKANFYYGTQVAPEGPGFGAIGASIGEGILTAELLNYLRGS